MPFPLKIAAQIQRRVVIAYPDITGPLCATCASWVKRGEEFFRHVLRRPKARLRAARCEIETAILLEDTKTMAFA